MKILLVINDAPYGTEKAYNALRLAMTLQKEHTDVEVRIFLMADAVFCALPGTNTPQGYYNIERMMKSVLNRGGKVKACGTCAQARGIFDLPVLEGVERSNMSEYTQWVVESDKVINC
ncbi:MAG: DsrE family protein [Ignavibacteria bacterium]|nr:DsrE family protein [Ignavibacteria bacterium]